MFSDGIQMKMQVYNNVLVRMKLKWYSQTLTVEIIIVILDSPTSPSSSVTSQVNYDNSTSLLELAGNKLEVNLANDL